MIVLTLKTKPMVRIVNYIERVSEDGSSFFALEVQGGIEMIRSKKSGNLYATAKKATIPSTFDEETCQGLIGTELEGNVVKKPCEPYQYKIKETGEVIELHHTYMYEPADLKEESPKQEQKSVKADLDTFSLNEAH